MRGNPSRRNQNLYCTYHKDKGHTTEQCRVLKDHLEQLVKAEHLKEFLAAIRNQKVGQADRLRGNPLPPLFRVIEVIHSIPKGAPASRTRRILAVVPAESCAGEHSPRKKLRYTKQPIAFDDNDMEGTIRPHDNALVVMAHVRGFIVKRIMIDQGSGADVMYPDLYRGLRLKKEDMSKYDTPLMGFDGHIIPEGQISLLVNMKGKEVTVTFIVVTSFSSYTTILGRPWIHDMGAVPSTLQQLQEEVGVSCVEDLVKVKILSDCERSFLIGASLKDEEKVELLLFLVQTMDVFAWSPYEVLGVGPEFIVHKFNVDPLYPPKKQRSRRLAKEHVEAVRQEVGKLKEAGAIKETFFPKWLANTVVVRKKNGKWRVCVDFTNLNQACPKDPFPMPKIDQLVIAVYRHPRMSFLDTFQGYHQIALSVEDQEKTAFITPDANCHYTVMPFGLKNAGATYQRMMTRMFRDKIGHTVESLLRRSDFMWRISKWGTRLGSFDIRYRPRNSMKGQVLANFIAEFSPKITEMDCLVGVNPWKVEYEALLAGLRVVSNLGAKEVEIYLDSQLVVNQVQGSFEAKDPQIVEYLWVVKQTMGYFSNVKVEQVARGQNRHADSLATLASSITNEVPRLIRVELVAKLSISARTGVSQVTTAGNCWMDPIVKFFAEDRIPEDEKKAARVQQNASRYWLSTDRKLYRRSFEGPYLQCLHPSMTEELLAKLHEGVCGSHVGGRSLAHRSNGQAKATNKAIVNELKKRLEGAKGKWAKELRSVLWAYQTTPRRSIEETPFSLTFGAKAVIPAKINLCSARVVGFALAENEELMFGQLNLLEEHREATTIRLAEYQQKLN
ncbi:uncharacterized protein LOC142612219 [Castanea sativa]|uniref:uncharacterized protein LOC142612219 n=1 Tax=Castanea sativa TaxID=21020 RepID=UPI003F64E721